VPMMASVSVAHPFTESLCAAWVGAWLSDVVSVQSVVIELGLALNACTTRITLAMINT